MAPTMPSPAGISLCQHLERWHAAHRYGHQQALAKALDSDARAIAGMLGSTSRRTLSSYTNIDPEQHRRGPAEKLEAIMVAALQLGRPVDDALAPLVALADAFGFRLVSREAEAGCPLSVVGDFVRVAGETIHTLTEAAADRSIDESELPEAKQRLRRIREARDLVETTFEQDAARVARERAERSRNAAPLRQVIGGTK